MKPVIKNQVQKVDALFADYSRGSVPGAVVMVIEEGNILLTRCYGLADIERGARITRRTAFRLASVTKPFTAMAIMILKEKGQLTYDDPLARFFPQFPAYASKITVRHLLNHTSGLPEYDCLFVNAKDKAKRIDIDWPRSSASKPSSYEPTSDDVLEILAEQRSLEFQPGDKYEYNNSEYIVLAQIVEKVSGKRFRDFLADEIFEEIRMSHTMLYDETRPVIPNRARGYTGMCGVYRQIDYTPLNLVYGEDNIYTTIDDMHQWDQALEKNELVKPETLKEAFTPGLLNSRRRCDYGFGWIIERFLGFDVVRHNGLFAGFHTDLFRLPDRRFTVVVLANCDLINAPNLSEKIAEIYLGGTRVAP